MDAALRILILEDNPADAELIQFELQEADIAYTAKVVMTEKDFIHALQAFSPDIVLSDYDLPQYNGPTALAEVKKRYPDIPFILVTGAVSEERAIEILTSGAKDYVMKSRLSRLVPAIRRVLAESEERRVRKKAQEEAFEASRYARTLLEASLDPLVTISPDGKVMDVNRATEEITGIPRHRLIGTDFADYFTEPKKARAGYRRAFSKGSVKDYPLAIRHASGFYETEVLYNATTYTNEKGEVKGVFAVARDVTELKKAEARLRKAKEELEQKVNRRTLELQSEIEERKGIEEELRLSEQRERERAAQFEALFEAVPTPVFIAHDPDCLHISGNRAADDLLKIPDGMEISLSAPAGVRPRHFKAFKDGRELRNEELPAQRAACGFPVRDFEFDLVFDDGSTRHVMGYGTPLPDGNGRPRGAVHVLVDITERKRAEDALRESEERLRLALRASSIGAFEFDLVTGEGRWNTTEYELLGLSPADTPAGPETFFRFVHPDDIGRLRSQWEEALRTGTLDTEFRIVRADGRERWLAGKGQILFGGRPSGDDPAAAGKPLRFMGVNFDITERKRADEALKKADTRAAALIKYAPTAIYEIDYRGPRFLSVNDAMCNILGYTQEELLSLDPSDLLDEESRALFANRIVRQMAGENIEESVEYGVRKKDGSLIYAILNVSFDPGSESGNVLVIAHDMTERKRSEEEIRKKAEQLEAVNKELESFSYSVSHDLRAPLRAIDGYLRMILKKQGDHFDEETRRHFDRTRECTKSMGQLIDDLLALSKLSRQDLNAGSLDVRQLIEQAWEELRSLFPDRNMTLKMDAPPPGWGDQGLVKQVIVNILSNAIKFTRGRDAAIIEAGGYGNGSETVYYVKDNGVGFDMQYHDKLFGVFQRLHGAEEYEGTGIGLSLVQRIVHRHGGRVWAEGKVDEGATFYFTLPARG